MEARRRKGAFRGKKEMAGEAGFRKSGEVAAALFSLLLGMAALTAAHWWSTAAPDRANLTLLRFSSWLPNGLRIGPYGGKELAALVVWLGSWGVLTLLLGRFELRLRGWIALFLAGVFVLLVLLWPPVIHRIYGWPV